jgi:hypothetical protein
MEPFFQKLNAERIARSGFFVRFFIIKEGGIGGERCIGNLETAKKLIRKGLDKPLEMCDTTGVEGNSDKYRKF